MGSTGDVTVYYLLKIKEDSSYTVSPDHTLIYEESRVLKVGDEVGLMWERRVKGRTATKKYTGKILKKDTDQAALHKEQDRLVAEDSAKLKAALAKKKVTKQKQKCHKENGETSTSSENDNSSDQDSGDDEEVLLLSELGRGKRDKKRSKSVYSSESEDEPTKCEVKRSKKGTSEKAENTAAQAVAAHETNKELAAMDVTPSPSKDELRQVIERLQAEKNNYKKQTEFHAEPKKSKKSKKSEHRSEKTHHNPDILKPAPQEIHKEPAALDKISEPAALDKISEVLTPPAPQENQKEPAAFDNMNLSDSDSIAKDTQQEVTNQEVPGPQMEDGRGELEPHEKPQAYKGLMFRFKGTDQNVAHLGDGFTFCSQNAINDALPKCAAHTAVARTLFGSVFTEEALKSCSLKGGINNGPHGSDKRPPLGQ